MNNTMMELCCRDCGSHYYLLRRNLIEDSGLCAKCDNEIAYLEEKYGTPKVDEWKVFLQGIGALALVAVAYGYGAFYAWRGMRALWRLL